MKYLSKRLLENYPKQDFYLIAEASMKAPDDKKYDIFLSHSYSDKEYIGRLYSFLTQKGYTVYVDWIEDEFLDREAVSAETAEQIQNRMIKCDCLLYATSENSTHSKWMPWELGYFDGIKGKVAILPLVENDNDSFRGSEYLQLYPKAELSTNGDIRISNGKSVELGKWTNRDKRNAQLLYL